MADLNPNPAQVTPPEAAPVAPVAAIPSAAETTSLSEMFSSAASAGEVAPVTAPETPSATITPAAPQPSAYAQQAADLGIQVPATATDAEVFAAMQNQLQAQRPYAQFGQSLMPHADEINQFFAARGQPAPQTAADAPPAWSVDGHFKQAWNVPQLSQDMQFAINNGMVIRDAETGMMVAKPGMEMMVTPLLGPMNQALNFQRQQWQDIMQANPYEKFYGVMKDPIERQIDARVQQILSSRTNQQSAADGVNQFEQANADWLYQSSNTGTPMPTARGTQFVNLVKQASESWTGDSATLLHLCKAAVFGVAPQAAAAPAAAVVATAAPVAPATPAAVSQAKKASFLDTALQQAVHQPSGGSNTVQSDTGPVSVTQTELEDMFLRDFQAANTAA